ncbi:hypothetical protein CDAR_315951 [Caerostris darwini]|uniref:Uncharacterized protein n=1 Tax=Caerostris darwini TaxID=1538125 RepID=A0AAV4M9I9_9ARAC|nr:hypothetical protein CDAR_315951 [Caerostris darwini]
MKCPPRGKSRGEVPRMKLFCRHHRRDQRTISASMEEYLLDFLETLRRLKVVLLVVTDISEMATVKRPVENKKPTARLPMTPTIRPKAGFSGQ